MHQIDRNGRLFSLTTMDTDFDLESLVHVEQTYVFSHLEP